MAVTHDGSITIVASPTEKEGSVFRRRNSEGNVLYQIDAPIIKEAIDAMRRWEARHIPKAGGFPRAKGGTRSFYDELGTLPKPNWSFVEIATNPEHDSADVTIPLEATLSSPHLFVISGTSLLPLINTETPEGVKAAIQDQSSAEIHSEPCGDTDSQNSTQSFPFSLSSTESILSSVRSLGDDVECTCRRERRCENSPCSSDRLPIKLVQNDASHCVSYKIMENALIEISLQSFKVCMCDGKTVSGPYFGPWTIAIKKGFIKNLLRVEADWKKKIKLRGPLWPPYETYKVKTSIKETCLRQGLKKKRLSEVLEYIIETNTDKFHTEAPVTVRLGWFMEKQLRKTELVNSVFDWRTPDVIQWLNTRVCLPQYKVCFEKNGLCGRHLVLLDAERLEKMGIRDFDHILRISAEIRKLFKSKREKNIWREVTEARYDPLTLHAMYNYKSVNHRLPVFDFFMNNHFINRKIPHYSMFELKRPVWDVFPRNIRTAQPKAYFKTDTNTPPKGRKQLDVIARW